VSLQNENEYEDLLSLWSDLESGLGVILGSPDSIQEFEPRVWQYDRWMRALLRRDTDLGLYLLFQLATLSMVGYSASHALVSAVLCDLIAVELKLPQAERDSLVHAALTMNIGMTALQDELVGQIDKPSNEQQIAIRAHAVKGGLMLANMGVVDELWLDTVSLHHDETTGLGEYRDQAPARRLARILRTVDRYGAMISPRKSREGRSATESMRALTSNLARQNDEVGFALLHAVGLFPPGTFVRLENNEVAVVLRRSDHPNQPQVATLISAAGTPMNHPRLHQTTVGNPAIKAALAASSVRVHLNHHLILQLGADTEERS